MNAARDERWVALYVLCVGMLMIVLDVTVVNVALPSIQRDLHFTQSSLTWVINGYLITFGGFLLLAGRMGDLVGRKRVFLTGLVMFTAASVLCQYDRDRFDPVTLASVAGFHTRSVAAATYYADALLRICRQYAPPGIRAAGELDYQAEEPLALALAEAVRLDGDVVINLSGLTFIDARCTLLVADAARAIASSGRAVTVQCVPGVGKGFTRLGIARVPGLRLVTAGEQ